MATIIEYALIAALLAVVVITGLTSVGQKQPTPQVQSVTTTYRTIPGGTFIAFSCSSGGVKWNPRANGLCYSADRPK